MGALKSSGAIKNTFLAYLASQASRSGGGSIIPTIQGLADPIYLSNFARPSDVVAGLWDIDLALGRFQLAAPFATNGFISWLKIDDIARAQSVISTSITGLAFNQANPQVTTVPSEAALRITGPASGGIIQCKGSSPGNNTWTLNSGGPNNHGLIDVEDIWAMGDPTLAGGTADSNAFMSIGPFYDQFTRRMRIYGFLGATNVLIFTSSTCGETRDIHLCGCGALATNPTGANIYVQGYEQSWVASGWINNTQAAPANVPNPANKNVSTTPFILRGPSVGSANASGAGDLWEEMEAGDFTSAAMIVNSNVLGGGVTGVGPQKVINFYLNANCLGTSGPGGLSFQGVQGGVSIFGGRCRTNGSSVTPAVSFLGGVDSVKIERMRIDFGFGIYFGNQAGSQNGPAEFDEVISDTPGTRVPVMTTATINGAAGTAAVYPVLASGGVAIEEKYLGMRSDYQTDSGSGVSVNQTLVVAGTGPTVGTAGTGATAQDIIGVAATTVAPATGALDIVQRRMQRGVVVINDGAGALAATTKITPSAATAGRVKAAGSAAVSIGVVENSIAGAAGSTGGARLI